MLWSELRLILKTSSVTPDFFYVFYLILSFSTVSQKKSVCGKFLGANVLRQLRIQRSYFTLQVHNCKYTFHSFDTAVGAGGERFCLPCPACYSSFCDLSFFTPNKGERGKAPRAPPLDQPLNPIALCITMKSSMYAKQFRAIL